MREKMKHSKRRLVYLIYLLNILEDQRYFAMPESTKMKNPECLIKLLIVRRSVDMYMEIRCYFGFMKSPQELEKVKDERQYFFDICVC